MKPATLQPNTHRPRPATSLFVMACLMAAFALLTSCAGPRAGAGSNPSLRNAILLWHNLPEQEAVALENVIDRYRRANPEVEVVVQPQGADMDAQFLRATRSGLGPNLLLTGSTGLRELVADGAILPLDQRLSADDLARYLSVALRTLQVDGQLYGQPMAVATQVLYTNRALVDQPPSTLDELMEAVNGGQRILMNSQFLEMVWSARAFGVELFDGRGAPQDTTAGIANWLAWTEQVRDTPGFILDDNSEALRNRFLEGDIPYYVGRSDELGALSAALDADLGVAPLPAGPGGSAGPPLTTTALLINALSSERQIQHSLELVRFITSSDQQAALMREASLASANGQTRISEGLYPRIAAVTAQARTSIPYSSETLIQEAHAVLAEAFNRTMSGLAAASEAAASAQATLIDQFGFPGGETASAVCDASGPLTLLADRSARQHIILRTLVNGFARVCPGITVTIRSAPLSDSLDDVVATTEQVQEAIVATGADLLFMPHLDLPTLAEAGVIAPITGLLDSALMQQMRPITVLAMRSANQFYGVPVMVDLQTLYHNRDLVSDPAGTLADLRAQAQNGAPVVLDGSFAWGFWGVGAFGGQLFGPDGQFALSPIALTRWLAWLQESGQRFSIRSTPARSEVRQLFLDGRSAYYVGISNEFAELAGRLGEENLAVALMPQGPAGPGRPLTTIDGLMLPAGLSTQQAALAGRFLNYAASVAAQTDLLDEHQVLPANSGVRLGAYPDAVRMAVQLQTSALLQRTPWLEIVFQLGDQAYRQVLQEGRDPAEAVAEMYDQLSAEAERHEIIMPTPEAPQLPAPANAPVDETPPLDETPPAVETPTGSNEESPTPPAPVGRVP
jgi:arabinogalactan oligomer/maltooligosaccharide transport system substrate-binding protein